MLGIDPYKRDWSKYKRGGMMTDEEAAQAAVTHLTLDAELLEALRACEATTSGSSAASTACSVLECSVCIEEVALGANIAKLPCAHMFHSECITPWLKVQLVCPNCRKHILQPLA